METVLPSISFLPLQCDHFSLLHRWLNSPHVAKYWKRERLVSLDDITAKYSSYVKGYKQTDHPAKEIQKPIHPFIITYEGQPIGYIQCYNAYDFPRENNISIEGADFPESLASLDLYIGETEALGKGLGPVIITSFIEEYIWPFFSACFLDCAGDNKRARRAYKKAGFVITPQQGDNNSVWMIKIKK